MVAGLHQNGNMEDWEKGERGKWEGVSSPAKKEEEEAKSTVKRQRLNLTSHWKMVKQWMMSFDSERRVVSIELPLLAREEGRAGEKIKDQHM